MFGMYQPWSTQPSTTWYLRPTFMTLTGILAAYSFYRLVVVSDHVQSSTLHRRNAIHQPRRRQPYPQPLAPEEGVLAMNFRHPTPQAPFGALEISEGDRSHSRLIIFRLGVDQMPPMEDLILMFPVSTPVYGNILANSMSSVLYMCAQLRDRPSDAETPRFDPDGIRELWDAVRTRSESGLMALVSDLPILLGLDTTTPSPHGAISHEVVDKFITSTIWQQPPGGEFLVPVYNHLDDFTVSDPGDTDGGMEMATNNAPNHDAREAIYYIAQENAKRKAYVHRGIRCESCNEFPILGVRYHCLNCPDYDLCAACEAHATHPKNHVFAKIKIPLALLSQPPKPHKLWYAGDPRKIHASLDIALRKQLCRDSGFDEAELDALYDQFTCIANVPWDEDPSRIGATIDRRAFDKTMSSDRWTNRFAPNVLLDRMFAFYDTDGNSLIGFLEFVDGMEYLRGSKRFASLQRALQGFDLDCDTYISRADFVRVLRGKFEIQSQLIIDATEGFETERTQGAMNVLRSSQPISSVFNGEQIPPEEHRALNGKIVDANGGALPEGDERTILDDEEPFFGRTRAGPEQLNAALARFDDLVHGIESTNAPNATGDGTDLFSALRGSLEGGSADLLGGPLVSLAAHLTDATEPEPYVQDLLWHVKEEALNSLLDPLFDRREAVEKRAFATRDARKQWRTAIDQFRNDLETPSRPIVMATPADDRTGRLSARGIVPTDHESLERLEMETNQAPLDVLLEVSGYSIREDPDEPAGDTSDRSSHAATIHSGGQGLRTRAFMSSPLGTMSAIDDGHSSPQSGESKEEPPSADILKLWVQLDAVDREVQERGGPGRLSLAEVEKTVVEKQLHDIRALIKSWLEWCAF